MWKNERGSIIIMKKALSGILLLSLLLMLSACGNTSDGSVSSAASGSSEASTSVADGSTEVSSSAETSSSAEVSSSADSSTDSSAANGKTVVNVAALKGPTAMGMVQFMHESDSGADMECDYQFSIAAAADEITPLLAKGELDIAAVPANLAAVLYNNNERFVEVLAVNTLGVLYIVENGDSIQSVEDLRGKTIYASGKGATPEYALNYILSGNGIDPESDVTIEWKSEHTECLTAVLAEENGIALLPQPFVTTALTKGDNLRVALDLNTLWDDLQASSETPSALLTGVVVVRREFAETYPEAVSDFLARYQTSVEYVNSNTEDAAQLVGEYDIVTAEVAREALPACNIVCITGTEMQEKLSGYLSVLLEQNPTSIGGTLPEDDFYYIA